MEIEVQPNPNCQASSQFVFNEIEAPRAIKGLRMGDDRGETVCDVAGVDGKGRFAAAFAVKITDSGAGFAYLIYGGEWGIRLRPQFYAREPWDLNNEHQWGEPFKIYGEEEDILFS